MRALFADDLGDAETARAAYADLREADPGARPRTKRRLVPIEWCAIYTGVLYSGAPFNGALYILMV